MTIDPRDVTTSYFIPKFGLIDLNTFSKENKVGDAEAFSAIKAIYPRSIRAGRLVLARTPGLDTAFENAIGKQLKVFNELGAESLLVGIERQASYRQTPLVGLKADLIAMIKELAGENPSFTIFRANTLEDPELSQTDEWILEVFRDSPTGMLHRNEITAAAMRDGKNVNSIGIFLLFNPLIRPVGSAVLALADQTVDIELVKQYAAIARAAEEPTQLDFSFQGSDILISFIPNLEQRCSECSLSDFGISEEEVLKALENLNTSRSPGPDGIHNKILF